MLDSGFKQIAIWQLDSCFLTPFGEEGAARRLHLITQLRRFLDELFKLGIPLEIWIDGSFTTQKPLPDDVDLVVWASESDAESLSPELFKLFDHLLDIHNNDQIKIRYDVDVYLADPGSEEERTKWLDEFGFDRSGINQKGIFTLLINHV
ncbi:hypothetical protein [Persicitalea sp.]|uniref:DUF6932 family protein n=1 Tax=Persicitalea sp. TaxID=3100273 RepID=UPI003594843E